MGYNSIQRNPYPIKIIGEYPEDVDRSLRDPEKPVLNEDRDRKP
jgi:hypothetical protein